MLNRFDDLDKTYVRPAPSGNMMHFGGKVFLPEVGEEYVVEVDGEDLEES